MGAVFKGVRGYFKNPEATAKEFKGGVAGHLS